MIDAMPKKLPLNCYREKDRHGKTRYYHRVKKGKRTALPCPTDPNFLTAVQAAQQNTPITPSRYDSKSLGWLCEKYKESARYAALAPSTRRMRDNILQRAVIASKGAKFTDIKPVHIERAMSTRSPSAANNFKKIMGYLFAWAKSMEYVAANPVQGISSIKYKTEGHYTWSIEDILQFCNHWPVGSKQRLAMALLLFTGLRRSDIVKLGTQHIKNDVISISSQKTNVTSYCKMANSLKQLISQTQTGDMIFITTHHDKPFSSADSFGNWFRDACVEAGVAGRAHGLRKAGATIAAECGATPHDLMSMYGWTSLENAELYTREANRKDLGVGVSERISNAFSPNLLSG